MTARKLLIAMLLVLVVGGGVRITQLLQAPATGTVSRSATNTTKSVQSREMQTGQYASFSYLSTMQRLADEKPVNPVLETYSYTSRGVSSMHLAVQVRELSSGKPSDDGSYHFREFTTNRFVKTSQTIGGKSVIVFTDKSSGIFDKTAYLQAGNRLASIQLQGGASAEASAAEFTAIISSWQWN